MRSIIWLLILTAPLAAFGETAYVTDNLRLGLHQAEDTSDRAFRTLESGQELEVLNRNRNYAQVRLPDGTLGYVKVAYLVDEKPAKLIVAQTQAANEDLQRRLTELNAAFSQPAATIEKLEAQVKEAQTALDEATEKLVSLEDENESLQRRQDQYKFSLPINWVSGALAFCLLAGFLGGLWWTDYRSRKRHGGVRIY